MKCEFMARQMPGIRAMVARELSRKGMTQEEIAKRIGITQAAVSQYLSSQRGTRLDPRVEPFFRGICEKMAEGKTTIEKEACEICKKIESI